MKKNSDNVGGGDIFFDSHCITTRHLEVRSWC